MNINDNIDTKEIWQQKSFVSFVLSILIIVIHNGSLNEFGVGDDLISYIDIIFHRFFKSLSLVAVPLFMIMSGYLFFRNYSNKTYFSKLKSRLFSLGLPYLIWNTIWLLYWIFLSLIIPDNLGREPFSFGFQDFLAGVLFHKYNPVFWFVENLLLFCVISPVLFYLIKNKIGGILTLIICSVLYWKNLWIPSGLIFGTSSLIYYMFGGYMVLHFPKLIHTQSNVKVVSIFVFIACISYYFILYKNGYTDSNITHWSYFSAILDIFVGFAYSISFWFVLQFVFQKISYQKYFVYSFWIFAMHIEIQVVIGKILTILLPNDPILFPIHFLLTIALTVTVIICIAKLLQTKAPTIYNLLSGGR